MTKKYIHLDKEANGKKILFSMDDFSYYPCITLNYLLCLKLGTISDPKLVRGISWLI